ncbi:ethanolamine utilization protein EutH [Clostridium sp. HCS.1]|uniref:ethanolamine utilization protein EutH n=1 Tax=Clostridium sp. HCS.1 TaxID=3238594 RepID=UPI003A0FFBF9
MEKIVVYIVGIFFVLGIFDYIIGGKLNLSRGIESGIKSMGSLALSMIGILSITPILSDVLIKYVIPLFNDSIITPSILSSSIIAVDMGGYKIAEAIASNKIEVYFSGILISSMLGCTISFTLPLALGIIKKKNIDILCKGILCGIVTLPIGLFLGGVLLEVHILDIIKNIFPIIIISFLMIIGLKKMADKMVKYFKALAKIIFLVGIIGLGLQGIKSITGIEIVKNLLPLEESITIVGKISIFLSGANVMIEVIKRIFENSIKKLGDLMSINSHSVTALIGSLASAVIVFTEFDKLDDRGKVICSAFSVAGAYVFGGQLAYVVTEAKEIVYIYIIVKLISGVLAILLALKITKKELS